MGSKSCGGHCLITNETAHDINFQSSNWSGYEYRLSLIRESPTILLPANFADFLASSFFKSNKHNIAGLIINQRLAENEFIFKNYDHCKDLIRNSVFPRTHKEIRDFLFIKLFQDITSEGQPIRINLMTVNPYKYFIRDRVELEFYLNALAESGYIDITGDKYETDVLRTYEGLNYAIELETSSELSRDVFIAMSFHEDCSNIRNAIKRACFETNYNPILIDEIEIMNEVTINDAIIANLKKCKFCISDFTKQSDGVYFESGFALGQGKKVLYTCQYDSFEKSHFDINHFPHLIYNNPDELTKKLVDRINAWI